MGYCGYPVRHQLEEGCRFLVFCCSRLYRNHAFNKLEVVSDSMLDFPVEDLFSNNGVCKTVEKEKDSR